jgi:signal transduction histidine kinase
MNLSRELLAAQENERRRIARELHDEIGQALTAVKINLQTALRTNAGSPDVALLEDSALIVDRTLERVRNLSLDLRPAMLDDLGLVPALRWYFDRLAHTEIAIQLDAEDWQRRLPPEVETTCFRVVQEALTNAIRHAQCRQVHVELRLQTVALQLVMRDNGIGFDVAEARARAGRGASLGLLGMFERVALLGGQIEIESQPGRGTLIRARFPITTRPDSPSTEFPPPAHSDRWRTSSVTRETSSSNPHAIGVLP